MNLNGSYDHPKPVKKVRFSDNIKQFSCDEDEDEDDENSSSSSANEVNIEYLSGLENVKNSDISPQIQSILPSNNDSDILCMKTEHDYCKTIDSFENLNLFQDDSEDGLNNIESNQLAFNNDTSVNPSSHVEEYETTVLERVANDAATDDTEGAVNAIAAADTVQGAEINTMSSAKGSVKLKHKSFNQKQSRKMNVIMKELNCSNALELKSTVFKAWCKVKTKTKDSAEKIPNKNIRTKPSTASKHAYLLWKKSKADASKNKSIHPRFTSSGDRQIVSKNDPEENEMAFKSWKKKKDEISKRKILEKEKQDQQLIATAVLKESEKRKDADAAFYAWQVHKLNDRKEKRKREAWLLEREQEEQVKKSLREKEAMEMYYMWLENKQSATSSSSHNSTRDKAPWFPP